MGFQDFGGILHGRPYLGRSNVSPKWLMKNFFPPVHQPFSGGVSMGRMDVVIWRNDREYEEQSFMPACRWNSG